MNPVANSVNHADEDVRQALGRLCDCNADVVYFPVRHHSPVAASLVDSLIQRLRPTAVLIEGPSDFNAHLEELFLDHELPIAIYSYFRKGTIHGGAYYPFCEYSPEWAALQAAQRIGAAVEFIDIPWSTVAHEDGLMHRFADGELRRGRFVDLLCQRMQVEDFDDLWDQLIESHPALELNDYLQRTHALCLQIRLWDEHISMADRKREAFMADRIRAVHADGKYPILVVTGGYHSGALAALHENLECPGIELMPAEAGPSAISFDEVGIALTTYSYERLDSLTGYNAGMPNPGFYEQAWRQRQAGSGFSHAALLQDLVRELRIRKQTMSTADLIAVETSARALAALRGRKHVWRRDLVDGVTSALIKDELEVGCESPFLSAVHAVLRGNRRGKLATGTRLPPLVVDIRDQLFATALEPKLQVQDLALDLLQPADLAKSRLLNRLRLLQIRGFEFIGGTDFLKRHNLRELRETWRIRWSPEFEASCIEASRFGTLLVDAVSNRLAEAASQPLTNAEVAAELLVEAARAGIEILSETLFDKLRRLIDAEAAFASITGALGHLLFLYCHDEALGTKEVPRIGALLDVTFERTLWVLEALGQAGGDARTQLRGMRAILETWQRANRILSLQQNEFSAVMHRVESDPRKPAALRGAAAGVLWTIGMANDEQILADLLLFAVPSDLGDFLAGLFAVAREVAQRHAQLVQTIDRLVNGFGANDFQEALPSLRLAFTYFTPREQHYMLSTLFDSLGLKPAQPLATLKVDAATAAEALALEERLFELIARYGLECRDE
ncbi:hypothetical protein SAMN05421753_10433 [Planctomicrobium piriforme]|uniref:4-aminobutyrate aminotransferase n=2 Tax=Planctomicrobium piriforme TaxID=1576369 RepID=A0A1I3E0R4_9PLAN|nr:hypothetical protein SAMN05421753_10433 [Planctomicrobium piriforme]